jgi:hypothetical protein
MPGSTSTYIQNLGGAIATSSLSSSDSSVLTAFSGDGFVSGLGLDMEGVLNYGEILQFDTGMYLEGMANWTIDYEYTAVPEPTSLALLTIGCLVLGLRRRR